ncbi:outer membrane protein [Bradyrhizobium sp. WD16]|uniref:outer membrane protein n=1 Tax=Bradyrhizobium sp. WD16 TaxID=1521768 RepID=UPI0020A58CB1|nr:outer membrane beta-barrel protein [Bradyrhizobium sp. WD16]UTD25854.1 porin family protein [Bradyrhizobium sp. WD16]
MRVKSFCALVFALAVGVGVGVGDGALAADLPVKAPIYSAAPVESSWAGLYVGVALGGKWTDAKWTTTQLVDPPAAAFGTAVIDASSPDRFRPAAFRVGGYAGYNWQTGPWVYGLEIDAAWSDASDTHAGVPGCRIECAVGFPGPGVDSSVIRALWDVSLRPRVGYLVTPETLVYGTGGVAWQSIEVSGTCANTLADPVCLISPPFAVKTQTDRHVLTGWTIGGGIERKFGAWLLRGEYRYSDFGNVSGVLFAGQPSADPGSDAVHYSVSTRTHTATLGLAYKF